MATTRISFAICILLSFATIAFADYYAPSSPPAHKPTLSPPVYTPPAHKPTLPPPVYTPIHKPILPPPVYMPTLSPPVYTKPSIPRPVYTPPANKPTLPPPVYTPPVYKPTLSPPVYTKPTLPPVYKPTLSPPVYKKSPSYSKPSPYVPKPTYTPPTKPHYLPEIIKAVGGIILCKNGYKSYPIQGAKAKIVCSEIGSYGKSKNEVVIYSDPSNSKGYFHVALTHIKDLSYCHVKLYTSPVESCKNPTNVNKGLTGFPLSIYSKENSKLFNVGSFYFTGPKAAPTTPKY